MFCPEVHTDKTKKNALLADIALRVSARGTFQEPRELDRYLSTVEEKKHLLTQYASLINKTVRPFIATVFEILWARDKCSQDISTQRLGWNRSLFRWSSSTGRGLPGGTCNDLGIRRRRWRASRYLPRRKAFPRGRLLRQVGTRWAFDRRGQRNTEHECQHSDAAHRSACFVPVLLKVVGCDAPVTLSSAAFLMETVRIVTTAPFERLHFRLPVFELERTKPIVQAAQQEVEALRAARSSLDAQFDMTLDGGMHNQNAKSEVARD